MEISERRMIKRLFALSFLGLILVILNSCQVSEAQNKDDQISLRRTLPGPAEIEAHFRDQNGSLPVNPSFDSEPDAICGNGKSYYWTSKPPKKPIPMSWQAPPVPGSDPDYTGPEPGIPFKESPYAMPTPKVILARKPIKDLGDPKLVDYLQHTLQSADGKIAYLGERDPTAVLKKLTQRMTNADASLFSDVFTVNEEQALAQQFLAEQINFILVDRTTPALTAWPEQQAASLRLRLRDGVNTSWFHTQVLGSGWVLYRIAEPLVLSGTEKQQLTQRMRALLSGSTTPEPLAINPAVELTGASRFRTIVSLRWRAEPGLKGRKLVKRIANGDTLLESLDKSAQRIKKDWPRIVQSTLQNKTINVQHVPERLADAIQQMEIEIDVLLDPTLLTDRKSHLSNYLELGLEGLSLLGENKRGQMTFHYLEPGYAVHMEVTSATVFLERLLKKNRFKQFLRPARKARNKKTRGQVLWESRWRADKEYEFSRFGTLNWIEATPGGEIIELYRGIPLKTLQDVSRKNLVQSLHLGAQWLLKHQSEDGQYAYKYTPTNKPGRRWMAGGNIVRHALNPYTLLMVNRIEANPDYVESAKQGIDFTLKFLRRSGDRCVICHRDPPARYYNAKLGTVAVTILSILKLAEVADISEYDDVLRCLAQELLFMQDPNGHFWQYDVPQDHPYYGAENTIAPGEFIFALARMYAYYGDERYRESIDRALPWYLESWRQLRSERTASGIYDEEHRVNLIGIVPWLVTAMNALHEHTGESRYSDIAFEMQDWIDQEFFLSEQRATYPDYLGGYFKMYRELPAINSCQYSEGSGAAYAMAKRINHRPEHYRKILLLGMRFCLQLQYDSVGSTFFLPVSDEAMGGYRYTLGHLRLRNDYNYHAMAAIAQAVEYLEVSDYPAQ